MAFDGIFLHSIIKDLQILKNGRIQRVHMLSKYELLLTIRSQKTNHKLLCSIHPMYARIHRTYLSYPTPDFPNSFTMLLRKHLEGSFISSIEQIELSRIIKITINGVNEIKDRINYYLYIEVMGKHSNIILTYDNGKVIDSMKHISPSESTRYMQPGVIYDLPPLLNKENPFIVKEYDDNLIRRYDGFSKDLSNEIDYLIHTRSYENIIKQLEGSQTFYYTLSPKEAYHIIPLTHLSNDYKEYSLNEGLDIFYNEKDVRDRIKQQTSDLKRFIDHEYDKNTKKLYKLEKTLFDSQNSDDLRIKGELLYNSLYMIEKGMTEVIVDNYYDNTKMTIPLDPRYDGKTNAQRYFHKYNKAKNAKQVLQTQIDETKENIEYFDNLKTLLSMASYDDALEIKEELENLGYLKKKHVKQLKKKKYPHYRTFETEDGIIIYVGKNNLQNDYLTFKQARKNDIWFHAKDMPGSHVIVHKEELDEDTIRLAAKLAAYYSKGKNSSSVPVNYTKVSTLKKPTGNKPGMVLLGHYNTIYIDPDEDIFEELKEIKQ